MSYQRRTHQVSRLCGRFLPGVVLAICALLFTGCASTESELNQAAEEVER